MVSIYIHSTLTHKAAIQKYIYFSLALFHFLCASLPLISCVRTLDWN